MLFTPRLSSTDQERLEMDITPEDMKKTGNRPFRPPQWEAEITDQNTGKRYLVRAAACSLPRCFCDAVIIKNLP
jgi:hypothetical protein